MAALAGDEAKKARDCKPLVDFPQMTCQSHFPEILVDVNDKSYSNSPLLVPQCGILMPRVIADRW